MILPHGEVDTPVFMPVGTNASVKAVHQDTLEKIGVRLILANTYHLYLRPGIEVIESLGGLHKFCTWGKNILTDSGGYQVFSLARLGRVDEKGLSFRSHIDGSAHELSPEEVIDLQCRFGSDISMPLDFCTPYGIKREEAERANAITLGWLARSREAWMKSGPRWGGLLFGIVQGGFFEDLRKRAVEATLRFELPGVAIGGLSVGESFEEFHHLIGVIAGELPRDVPRYVMGIGTPEYIFAAVENGFDLFDSVFPTRTARNGQVFTLRGTINLKKEYNRLDQRPIERACSCTACRQHTRAYLRHLFKAKEILGVMLATEHNLTFMEKLMSDIRLSIVAGSFTSFRDEFLENYQSGEK